MQERLLCTVQVRGVTDIATAEQIPANPGVRPCVHEVKPELRCGEHCLPNAAKVLPPADHFPQLKSHIISHYKASVPVHPFLLN